MEPFHGGGASVQDGAWKRTRYIRGCSNPRRYCCWTLAKKPISTPCHLFLRKGGIILCIVNGDRRYSADLIQGGLEVP